MSNTVRGLDLPDSIWQERACISGIFLATYTAVGIVCLSTANPVTDIYVNEGYGITVFFWILIDFLCLGALIAGVCNKNRWMVLPIVIKEGIEAVVRSIGLIVVGFRAVIHLTLKYRSNGSSEPDDNALYGLMLISFLLAPLHIVMFLCFCKYFTVLPKSSPSVPASPPPAYDAPPAY